MTPWSVVPQVYSDRIRVRYVRLRVNLLVVRVPEHRGLGGFPTKRETWKETQKDLGNPILFKIKGFRTELDRQKFMSRTISHRKTDTHIRTHVHTCTWIKENWNKNHFFCVFIGYKHFCFMYIYCISRFRVVKVRGLRYGTPISSNWYTIHWKVDICVWNLDGKYSIHYYSFNGPHHFSDPLFKNLIFRFEESKFRTEIGSVEYTGTLSMDRGNGWGRNQMGRYFTPECTHLPINDSIT